MTTPKTRPDSFPDIFDGNLQTPALVWDMDILDDRLDALCRFAEAQHCTLLYSIKASSVAPVLERIGARVSGFACSSPFEARLARQSSAPMAWSVSPARPFSLINTTSLTIPATISHSTHAISGKACPQSLLTACTTDCESIPRFRSSKIPVMIPAGKIQN